MRFLHYLVFVLHLVSGARASYNSYKRIWTGKLHRSHFKHFVNVSLDVYLPPSGNSHLQTQLLDDLHNKLVYASAHKRRGIGFTKKLSVGQWIDEPRIEIVNAACIRLTFHQFRPLLHTRFRRLGRRFMRISLLPIRAGKLTKAKHQIVLTEIKDTDLTDLTRDQSQLDVSALPLLYMRYGSMFCQRMQNFEAKSRPSMKIQGCGLIHRNFTILPHFYATGSEEGDSYTGSVFSYYLAVDLNRAIAAGVYRYQFDLITFWTLFRRNQLVRTSLSDMFYIETNM
jgi:hypothetical protein